MAFWNRKTKAEDTEVKYSEAGPISTTFVANRPAWTPRRYEQLADEAYLRNAVAFRCVKMIATAASTIPFILQRNNTEIEEHDILKILASPAPMVTQTQFLEAVFAYLMLSGNAYIESVGPERGAPKELWTLRPDRMKVIPSVYGTPAAYRYEVDGRHKDWKSDPITRKSPILHIKEFHPINDYYGMSRAEASAYGIDRHNAASAHNKALLDNGARPTGALIFKPTKVGDNEYKMAPQALIDAAMEKLNSLRTGSSNAGKPMVLGGDVTWEEMAVTPRDMDFNEGKLDAARDICYAFGVPHELIVPGDSTYNNKSEAKMAFYEETVIPLATTTFESLGMWLGQKFGLEDALLVPDLDSVSALEPRRETKRETTIKLLESGLLDLNEARELLQYGKRDKYSLSSAVDPQVLASLTAAAQQDEMMYEPLWRYMRSVGLVDRDVDFAQWVSDSLESLDENYEEEEEVEDDDQTQE